MECMQYVKKYTENFLWFMDDFRKLLSLYLNRHFTYLTAGYGLKATSSKTFVTYHNRLYIYNNSFSKENLKFSKIKLN